MDSYPLLLLYYSANGKYGGILCHDVAMLVERARIACDHSRRYAAEIEFRGRASSIVLAAKTLSPTCTSPELQLAVGASHLHRSRRS